MDELRIFPINFSYSDHKADGKLELVIHIYGYILNKESYVLLRVYDYKPFYYLVLDPRIDWTARNIEVLSKQLSKVETNTRSGNLCNVKPVKIRYKEGKSYFYKNDRLHPALRVEFTTKWAANSFATNVTSMIFKVDKHDTKVIPVEHKESQFDHVLKMYKDKGVKFGSWISIKEAIEVTEEDLKISNIREYITNVDQICPLSPEDMLSMPVVIPSILSFDIEQNSSIPLSFPTVWRPKDVIFMIGAVYRPQQFIYKDRDNIEPKLEKHMIVNGVCKDITDVSLYKYSKDGDVNRGELSILNAFTQLFELYYPAILLGHNIVAYDIDTMNARGHNYKNFSWGKFSIIKDHEVTVKPNNFSSKAYKLIKNIPFDLPGTLILDTCTISRREERLRSYKLDSVAREFIDAGKEDLTPLEIFSLFRFTSDMSNSLKDREEAMYRIATYCIMDCVLPILVFLKRNYWISMCVLSNVIYLPMGYIYTKGMLKRATSLMYSKAKDEDILMIPREITDNYKFEGGLVREPTIGLYTGLVIVLDLNSLYPTTLQEKNICTTTLENKDDPEFSYPKIPEEEWNTFSFTREELYSMIDVKETTDADGLVNSILGKEDIIYIRWHKGKTGIVPKAQYDLKLQRSKVKADMKKYEEGSLRYATLDAEQLALKLTANSLYGFLGFHPKTSDIKTKKTSSTDKMMHECYGYKGFTSGTYNCIEAAICVTKRGREINNMITEFLEDTLGKGIYKVIYGDTDSVFIDVKTVIEDGHRYIMMPNGSRLPLSAWKLVGKYLQDKVNSILPSPHNIDFEKAFYSLLLKGKKNYVAIPYSDNVFGIDPEYNKDIDLSKFKIGFDPSRIDYDTVKPYIRGMSLVRREDCKAILSCIERIIRQMLKNSSDLVALVNTAREEIINFLRCPKMSDLLMTVQISDSYKDTSNHANKKFVELQMKEYSRQFIAGERIEYIFVKTSGDAKVGEKMQTPDLYEQEGNDIDLEYYIEHRLANKIDQLLSIVFDMYPKKFNNFNGKLSRRIIYTKDGMPSIQLIKRYFCHFIKEANGDSDIFSKLLPPFTDEDFESKYKGIILTIPRRRL